MSKKSLKRKYINLDNIAGNHGKKTKLTDRNSMLIEQSMQKHIIRLGYTNFKPNQREIIMDIINGRNTFISMKSG